MPIPTLVAIASILVIAFAVETALGFGAALITVSLGAFVVEDLREILALTAPLNLALSIYLVGRYHAHVDRRFLFTRLLPLMGLGIPLGYLAVDALDEALLKRAFGLFVTAVAALELWRSIKKVPARPVSTPMEIALLIAGGAIHGAFLTGGPMAVYVTSRVIHDKAAYRATLSSLWLVLGAVMLALYVHDGRVSMATLPSTLAVSPGIVVGMILGEVAFARVPVDAFRRAVFAALIASGAALMVRG